MSTAKMATKAANAKPLFPTGETFVGTLGQVVHYGKSFFAWQDGCLIGTYTTFDDATESLALRDYRKTH